MISLLLATLFSACFSLVVRFAQGRRSNLWAVGATNYVVATLFHLSRALLSEGLPPSAPTVVLGAVTGLIYVNSYALILPFMALRGVSVSMAVTRLAVLIPVVCSIIVWGEQVNALQAMGALLALLALPFLGLKQKGNGERLPLQGLWLLLALFTSNGLGMLGVEAFHHAGIEGQDSLFLAFLFGAAMIVSCTVWFWKRKGSGWQDLPLGVLLGLCNALANLALVAALDRLSSVLVFPFYSAAGVAFTALFARVVWRERASRLETVGMVMALSAVIFINLA